jgi:hypothetical protein
MERGQYQNPGLEIGFPMRDVKLVGAQAAN